MRRSSVQRRTAAAARSTSESAAVFLSGLRLGRMLGASFLGLRGGPKAMRLHGKTG